MHLNKHSHFGSDVRLFCLFALLFDSIIIVYEREKRLFAAFFSSLCCRIVSFFHFHIRHWFPLCSIHGTFEFLNALHLKRWTLNAFSSFVCSNWNIWALAHCIHNHTIYEWIQKSEKLKSLSIFYFSCFFFSSVGMHYNPALMTY